MALGTISGITKNWNDKEIKGAQGAGLGFKPSKPVVKKTKKKASTTQNQNVSSLLTPYNALSNRVTPTQTFSNTGGVTSTSPSVNLAPPTPKIDNSNLFKAYNNSLNNNSSGGNNYNFMTGKNDYKGITQPPITTNEEVIQKEVIPTGGLDENTKNYIKQLLGEYPKVGKRDPYQGQYDDRILGALNRYENYQDFKFDPNDPRLKQLQDEAIQRSRVDSSRRGRTFDTYADIQAQEASQKLIPGFYNAQQNQYNQNRQQELNVINALRGADQTQYNRYADQYTADRGVDINEQGLYTKALDYGTKQEETDYGRAYDERTYQDKQIQNIEAQEQSEFGFTLPKQVRSDRELFLSLNEQDRGRLNQYSNDFAAEINRLRTIDPNHEDIPKLLAMRTNKILSNQKLLDEHGPSIGMETGAITAMGESKAYEEELRTYEKELQEFEKLKLDKVNKKYQAEIDKYAEQTKEVTETIKKIKAQTGVVKSEAITAYFDAVMKELEAENYPQLLKKKLADVIAGTKQKLASAYSSQASGDKSLAGIELIEEQKKETRARTSKIGKEIDNLDVDDQYVSDKYSQYLQSGKNIDEFLISPAKDGQGYTVYKPATADGERIPMTIAQTLDSKELKALQGLSEATEGKRDEDLIYLKDKFREDPEMLKLLDDTLLTKYLK